MKKAATLLISALLLISTAAVCLADVTHKVRRGDSLSRIARKYKVGVPAIKEANGLETDALSVGTRLTIPGAATSGKRKKGASAARKDSSSPAVASAAASPGAAGTRTDYHTVRKGETLGGIAREHGMTVKELKGLNGIRRAKRLKAGARLLVRQGAGRKHIGKDGDGIGAIAGSGNRDAGELVARSEPSTPDPKPGQELALDPAEAAPPSSPTSAARAEEIEKAVQAIAASGAAEEKPPGLKDRIIAIARKMIDIPYRFGGNTMLGIDCSGYVKKVFSFLHIELPRSAREQFGIGEEVQKGELKLGDLVFFKTYALYPSHVGIYVGNNEFIHASSKDRRVKVDSLDAPYYIKRFIGARRVIEAPPENGEL